MNENSLTKSTNTSYEIQSKNSFSNFKLAKLNNSQYINPFRVKFNQNNYDRIWDGVGFNLSIIILLGHLIYFKHFLKKRFCPMPRSHA